MNSNNSIKITDTTENVAAGIVGAFLFSLAGGLMWFLLNLVGFFSAISGFIGVVLAIKGYRIFAKKESVKGVIIASVIAFLVLVIAWYFCFGKDIYDAFQQWFKDGEIDYTLSFSQSLAAVPAFLTDPEVGPSYIRNLLVGLGFALLGSIGTIITSIRNIKARNKLFEQQNSGEASSDADGDAPEDSIALRSAQTDEKVREFLKTNAFGHEIVFRRVGKAREELVIDGSVYAEYVLVQKVQFPYQMQATLDGHRYEAGYDAGLGNFIAIDKVPVAKKFRW